MEWLYLLWVSKAEVLYFTVLLGSFAIILADLVRAVVPALRSGYTRCLCASLSLLALTILALWLTWTKIVFFIYDDFLDSRLPYIEWVQTTDIFNRSYVLVTDTPMGWWWTSQLLLVVLCVVCFLPTEAVRMKFASRKLLMAYFVVGFLGAISVMSPLFLARVLLTYGTGFAPSADRPLPPAPTLPTSMAITLLLGGIFIRFLPDSGDFFGPTLKAIHVILFLPALIMPLRKIAAMTHGRLSQGDWLVLNYGVPLAASAVTVYQMTSVVQGLLDEGESFYSTLLEAGFSHPCQASVSTDMLLTTTAFGIFAVVDPAFDVIKVDLRARKDRRRSAQCQLSQSLTRVLGFFASWCCGVPVCVAPWLLDVQRSQYGPF
eukprot:Rmarinus@m.127